MGHVVRVYKQALFRNHRLLSSIPPFTVEAQLCESILGSISAKHPRFRPFVARVCPSTPHSVTSNQGGTSATVDQNGLLMHGTNMDCGRALAPHILVAPGLIELQAFPDDAFQSNIYGSWQPSYETFIDRTKQRGITVSIPIHASPRVHRLV